MSEPVPGLEVIGAGFGRTGTRSLKEALERLGFGPCYHTAEVLKNPGHAELCEAAARGEPVDLDGPLGGYRATVDWPACSFYAELMELHPDAKVLLSVRDPERWYESARGTIYKSRRITHGHPFFATAARIAGWFAPKAGRTTRMINTLVWENTFDDGFEDKEHAIAVFEKHNAEVKGRVPPEKLLVYGVKQGWGPLCEFLGVEEPDEPFPHLNASAGFRRGLALGLSAALGTLALSAAALVLIRSRRRR